MVGGRCHLRSINLSDLECLSSWRLGYECSLSRRSRLNRSITSRISCSITELVPETEGMWKGSQQIVDQSLGDLAAVAENDLQAASGFGVDDSVSSASDCWYVVKRIERLGCGHCTCSTGVMTSVWTCRSAGTAMQSMYVAARIATRNRRWEISRFVRAVS